MKKIHILYILLPIMMLSACKRILLGPEVSNDPENNFELFWNNVDTHSGILGPKNIDWNAVYNQYRPQVTAETTDDELWTIFSEMIEVFDDEHTVIFRDDEAYGSGTQRIPDAKASFSKSLIRNTYLENYVRFDTIRLAPDFSFGKIKGKSIGYIYLGDTDGSDPKPMMDSIFRSIGNEKAIILDIRNNGGGFGDFARGVADAFAEETRLVYSSRTRNGPGYDDYDEPTEYFNTSDGENQFLMPVIMLTDARTVSAAEEIVVAMRLNSQVVHFGDTTAGAFSSLSPRRFLPNGWTYRYPIQISIDPAGTILDGDGQAPEVYSKNTPADIDNGVD
ncbi:MAG: S41 family peptidase, partial [Bacteroidia bacterium]